MRNSLILLVFSIISLNSFTTHAQSWRSLAGDAKKAYQEGKYLAAGDAFTQAWEKNESKTELIYRAGECYTLVKDYRKAAESFQHIKDENKKFDLVGLRYARALKQDGQYKAAIQEFVYFLSSYQADDKTVLTKIVNTEVKGCELALQQNETATKDTPISRLGSDINTSATEFAPVPFADDILYFSSTRKGTSRIYRTQQQNGEWKPVVKSEGIPESDDIHIANGSFSPDGSRFYFTECKPVQAQDETVTTHCEILVITRKNNAWSQPERLRDYINEATSTNTQPSIVHEKGKEIMYFASNRKGGQGGMDIWYAVRDINSNDVDFAVPVNLGTTINSLGDEISPYYDLNKKELYFSSNGLVTLGGHDIFKAEGSQKQWKTPENLGVPLNSPADDFYFSLNKSGNGGFFTSNRKFNKEKTHSHDEDIFAFTFAANKEAKVIGAITDADKNKVNGCSVALYDITDATQKRLLQLKTVKESEFEFKLLPEKKLRLEVQKENYVTAVAEFATPSEDKLENVKQLLILVAQPTLGGKTPSPTPNVVVNTAPIVPPAKVIEVAKPTLPAPVVASVNTAPTKPMPSINTAPTPSVADIKATTAPIKSPSIINEAPKTTEIKPPVVVTTTNTATPIQNASPTTPVTPAAIPVKSTAIVTIKPATPPVVVPVVVTKPAPAVIVAAPTVPKPAPVVTPTSPVKPVPNVVYNHTTTSDQTSASTTKINLPTTETSNKVTPRIMKGTKYEPNDVITTATVLPGVYFKIQLLAIEDFDAKQTRYQGVESLGKLESEFIIGKNLVRVLVGNVPEESEAVRLQNIAIRNGFPEAFIVRYEYGERLGRWK
jgi:tetratricopeptide (TPR) repeat protein